MPSLTKLLKKSVKDAKNGKGFKETVPTDLPEGVKLDKAGEFVFPEDLARCADILHITTKMRLALKRRVDKLEELETALENKFINELPKSSRGVSGLLAHAEVKDKPIPIVDGEEGWEKLYRYIARTKSWELLQRRLGEKAAKELLDAKKGAQAGLTIFNAKKVSCTKL